MRRYDDFPAYPMLNHVFNNNNKTQNESFYHNFSIHKQ